MCVYKTWDNPPYRQTNIQIYTILYGTVVKIHLNFIHLSLEKHQRELASSVSDSHLKPAKVVMLNSWQEFPKNREVNMGIYLLKYVCFFI